MVVAIRRAVNISHSFDHTYSSNFDRLKQFFRDDNETDVVEARLVIFEQSRIVKVQARKG